jgi:L-iditol 2-dehydrogenase
MQVLRKKKVMKALVKYQQGIGNVKLSEVPEPTFNEKEVKVAIAYAGLCGTDLHVFNDTFKNYPPVILGHELSGIVEEIGSGVTEFTPGDRVIILGSNKIVCGYCEYCKTGYYMFCSKRRGMGHGTNGGFTKFVVAREDMLYKIPAAMSLKEAAISEAFASSVQAVEEVASLTAGDTILITGPGPIGLMCLLLTSARRLRTYVAGTTSDTERLKIAEELGAICIRSDADDLKERIFRETNGRGVDAVFECSGNAAAITSALNVVRPMGQFIQMGLGASKVEINVEQLVHKGISFLGSVGHSMKTWEIMMRMFENGTVDLKPIITHEFPLSQWETAFELMRQQKALKIVFYYDFEG